jgi:UDP-perosamine 4-acetyltransferase
MTDLILIGAGGHARVVVEILRRARQSLVAAVDADQRLHGKTIDGIPIIGGDAEVLARRPDSVLLINAIGNRSVAVGTSGLGVRRRLFSDYVARGYRFGSVISPDALIASTVRLGDGCHIVTGAILQPGAEIGANTIINTGAQIDHDCVIGDHGHVAPGVVLCGGVRVGAEVHIGAGAVVVQETIIGDGATIGAGAVVTADVAPGATVLGVPARPVERRG